jgi:hypothetical protein
MAQKIRPARGVRTADGRSEQRCDGKKPRGRRIIVGSAAVHGRPRVRRGSGYGVVRDLLLRPYDDIDDCSE